MTDEVCHYYHTSHTILPKHNTLTYTYSQTVIHAWKTSLAYMIHTYISFIHHTIDEYDSMTS